MEGNQKQGTRIRNMADSSNSTTDPPPPPSGENEAEAAKPEPEPVPEMRCINLTGFGGIRNVKVTSKPQVTANEGEVLIRVKAW